MPQSKQEPFEKLVDFHVKRIKDLASQRQGEDEPLLAIEDILEDPEAYYPGNSAQSYWTSVGYLQGAADTINATVLELIDSIGN